MESHYSRKQWLEFQLLLSYQWLSGFKSSNRFPGTRQPLVSRLPGGKHGEVRHFRAQDSGWECGRVWVYQAWSLRFYLQRLQPSLVVPAFTLGGRQEGQKIKVARGYGSLCLKTRDSSVTSTAPAQGSLNS